MNLTLSDLVNQLKIGAKQTYENMTVFCLLSASEAGVDFITLDDALTNHSLVISEVSEGGSVPQLKVTNPSDKNVLLLDGEEVVGAKQNRVLNATIMIAPKSETIIPVSCVESGRWHYRSKKFESQSRTMSAALRKSKSDSVTRNLEDGRDFMSNQGLVWREIERKYQRMSVDPSPTMAMSDLYETVKVSSEQYLKKFFPVISQIGMIVLIDQEIAGVEILNHFDSFSRNHNKLVNSYVLDAIETNGERFNPGLRSLRFRAGKFLEAASNAEIMHRPSVGLGTDMRLKSKKLTGAGLEYEKQILQLSIFPSMNGDAPANVTPLRRASARRRSTEQ